jgi:hypothetical protein
VQRANVSSGPGLARTGGPASSGAALQRGVERPAGRKFDGVARSEGRGGGADAADLVDPVGAMSGAVGSFGVEQEPAGVAAPQRVRLDPAPVAVVEQVYAEVIGGGEAGRLQIDSPRGTTPS